jgi:hypothetical protein
MCFPRCRCCAPAWRQRRRHAPPSVAELLQLSVGEQLRVRGVETKPPHPRQRHSRARAVATIRIVQHVLSQCLDAQPQLTSRRAQTGLKLAPRLKQVHDAATLLLLREDLRLQLVAVARQSPGGEQWVATLPDAALQCRNGVGPLCVTIAS